MGGLTAGASQCWTPRLSPGQSLVHSPAHLAGVPWDHSPWKLGGSSAVSGEHWRGSRSSGLSLHGKPNSSGQQPLGRQRSLGMGCTYQWGLSRHSILSWMLQARQYNRYLAARLPVCCQNMLHHKSMQIYSTDGSLWSASSRRRKTADRLAQGMPEGCCFAERLGGGALAAAP